jgi:hypothetical protein
MNLFKGINWAHTMSLATPAIGAKMLEKGEAGEDRKVLLTEVALK